MIMEMRGFEPLTPYMRTGNWRFRRDPLARRGIEPSPGRNKIAGNSRGGHPTYKFVANRFY